MIAAKSVPESEIDRAKNFIRKPLSEGFRAWTTLRDRDNVTMTIQELGHLMAWYAMLRGEELVRNATANPAGCGAPLPAPSSVPREFMYRTLPAEAYKAPEDPCQK